MVMPLQNLGERELSERSLLIDCGHFDTYGGTVLVKFLRTLCSAVPISKSMRQILTGNPAEIQI